MNNAELKLEVVSPTTIKCGHIEWFALDTKLIGKVKVLLEENEELKKVNKNLLLCNFESDDKINKAIEYIEEHERNVYDTFGEGIVFGEMSGIKEILDILRGEDNESN